MIRLLCCVGLLLIAAPAGAEQRAAGILPLVGPGAQQLNPALGRAVAELGGQAVQGPVELQARLAADPEVAAALEQAREALALARERELRMLRAPSMRAAQEALTQLQRVHGRYHAPALVVQAELTLAQAQQLRPADDRASRAALARALAVDPGFEPEEGQLQPHLQQLLEAEREQTRQQPPSTAALRWLAGRLQLGQLVWLRVDGQRIEVLVFDRQADRVRRRLRGTLSGTPVLERAARLVNQALGGAQQRTEQRPAPAPTARPWYRRWWVWTAAGVVLAAGAAVGLTLALRPDDDPSRYDLHFHF